MKIIAHRGAIEHYPENTLEAMVKACELGFDGVECDVRRCQSGELVLMYDKSVNRTTNGRGRVSDLTLSQLKNLRIAGSYQIPTVVEILKALPKKFIINFEIKSADPSIAPELSKLSGSGRRILISSKWSKALAADVAIPQAYIHPILSNAIAVAQKHKLTTVVTRNFWLNRWAAKRQHDLNKLEFWVHPVKTSRQARKLQEAGFIGLICDQQIEL